MASILYLGDSDPFSTSAHRANALTRIGYQVAIHNAYEALGFKRGSRFSFAFHYQTGFRFVQRKVKRWLVSILDSSKKPDIIWINSGEFFGPGCLALLKELGSPVLLYNNDDPTGLRDGSRFGSLIKSLPFFDLCVVMRDVNIAEYIDRGAKRILRVRMSYDEIAHDATGMQHDPTGKYVSDVAFIGTWMKNEDRDLFLLDLIRQGINVSIWGDNWYKSPYWSDIRPGFKGPALTGCNYVAAIRGAKICIGLLSKGNRDQHTQRSLEIPYAGGLLCAERTREHLELFREGEEAVFWFDSTECAVACKELLLDETLRQKIALAGMNRVRSLSIGNEDTCRKILEVLMDTSGPPVVKANYPLHKLNHS
jgi:spore maturation protein CgeB